MVWCTSFEVMMGRWRGWGRGGCLIGAEVSGFRLRWVCLNRCNGRRYVSDGQMCTILSSSISDLFCSDNIWKRKVNAQHTLHPLENALRYCIMLLYSLNVIRKRHLNKSNDKEEKGDGGTPSGNSAKARCNTV